MSRKGVISPFYALYIICWCPKLNKTLAIYTRYGDVISDQIERILVQFIEGTHQKKSNMEEI